ncbi:MAG: oligosaccharide flippase family protein [FCB group bacterium]|nr:oligosaccharide flippase family protein [FCB group bacterium]
MKQDFKILVKHFITYGIGVYLTKLIGFFMIPIYTAYLTPADYGVLELLDLSMYVVGMFVGMGITNSIIRFYSDCETEDDKNSTISTAFFYVLIVSLCVNSLLIFFSSSISQLIFHSGESTYSQEQLSFFVKIVATSGVMDILAVVGTALLQAEKRSRLFTIISITRFTISVSLNIIFIVGLGLGVAGVLYSQIISSFVAFACMMFVLRRRLRPSISVARAKEMLKYGAPLVISTFSMFIIHFSDRFFLERFSGLSVLGVYSLSYKFALILPALFYGPFEMIWNTQMFDLYKKGEEGRRTINYIHKYILVFSLLFITAYALCVKDLIFIMADPKFHEAYRVVPVLLLAFLFIGLASISSAGIFFVKKTLYRGLANIYGAAVALAGYWFLIRLYGYWGAVITTLLAFLVRYIALSIYSQRFYRLEYSFLLYFRVAVATGTSYLAGSMISLDNNYLSLLARGAAGLILFMIMALALKIFSRYELDAFRSILKRGRRERTTAQ